MFPYRQNSVLLLKGEKKEQYKDDPYVSLLCQGGYEATCIPVLGFQFINLDLLREVLYHPDEYSSLLLTSPRAIEAISKAVTDEDYLQNVWSEKPTFVVSSVTGSLAESIGLKVKGTECGNSEKLAPYLIKEVSGDGQLLSQPILFPCGNLKLDTLPSALQAAGISVRCVTVYETTPDVNLSDNLDAFLKTNSLAEYIVFYSPSGVNSTFLLLQQLGCLHKDVKLIAIGPTTEKAIKARGGNVWGTLAQPTAEDLLKLLINTNQS